MTKGNTLRTDRILDFYDVPQLLTARDGFDTLYLCLLYDDTPVCRYSAIRISAARLQAFENGKHDLRTLFETPENAGEYFDVEYSENAFHLQAQMDFLPKERLPEQGYTLSNDGQECVVVSLPTKDRGLFFDLVRKFGWVCM